MKIVCIKASPRKNGNSSALAENFLKTAEARGANIRTYTLNDLEYKPCQACYACKRRLNHCALQDDLIPVLNAFSQCDLAVLATPVYYADISAQLKAFIDRTFSLLNPDYHSRPDPARFAPGKKMLWIITQEAPEERHGDIFKRYAEMFKYIGCDPYLIRGVCVEIPGEVKSKLEVMKETEELARKLVLCD